MAMGQDNLDFLVHNVPGVINVLNETDASIENTSASYKLFHCCG